MEKWTDEQIRELCERATEGPWHNNGPYIDASLRVAVDLCVCKLDHRKNLNDAQADAQFIAAARELVPQLLERAQRAELRASEMRDEIVAELVDAVGLECDLCIYWRKDSKDKAPACKDCLLNEDGVGTHVAFDGVGTGWAEEGEPTATIPRLYHLWQKAETRLQAVRVALDKQRADTDKAYEQGHRDARMAYEAGLWDEVGEG